VLVVGDAQDAYGNKVVLDNGGGFVSVYAHLASFGSGISQGATISQGQLLGYAGNTGGPYPVHLHIHMQRGLSAYKPEPMSSVSGFGQFGFSKDDGSCDDDGASPYWMSWPPNYINLLVDSSFEQSNVCDNTCAWRRIHPPPGPPTQLTYWNLLTSPSPKSGSKFLRFGSTVAGGSIYQDVLNTNPSPGDSYVFSMWTRSATAGCVKGTIALWGLGIANEPGSTPFEVCGTSWKLVSAPLDAQLSNPHLRAQVYADDLNLLDVDATELIQTKDKNASFETPDVCDNTCSWRRIHPIEYPLQQTHWSRVQDTARNANASGQWYLRANRTGGTGASSVYQDIRIVVTPGERYTLTVAMRQGAPYPGQGRSGTLRLWALGGNSQYFDYNFNLTLPSWTQFTVVLNVTQPGNTYLRAEVYFNTPGPNYDIDATKLIKNY